LKDSPDIDTRTPKGQRTIATRQDSSSATNDSPSPSSRSRAKLFLVLTVVLFAVFIVVESIFRSGSPKDNAPSKKRTVSIQLEVLNGTTEQGIAQRLTERLRAGGFDVVDIGNYRSSDVANTLIIARTTNGSAAQSVASFLGVDERHVLSQPDKYLYLDVSVVIGKDISQLRVFK
jgi:hypothetical protein